MSDDPTGADRRLPAARLLNPWAVPPSPPPPCFPFGDALDLLPSLLRAGELSALAWPQRMPKALRRPVDLSGAAGVARYLDGWQQLFTERLFPIEVWPRRGTSVREQPLLHGLDAIQLQLLGVACGCSWQPGSMKEPLDLFIRLRWYEMTGEEELREELEADYGVPLPLDFLPEQAAALLAGHRFPYGSLHDTFAFSAMETGSFFLDVCPACMENADYYLGTDEDDEPVLWEERLEWTAENVAFWRDHWHPTHRRVYRRAMQVMAWVQRDEGAGVTRILEALVEAWLEHQRQSDYNLARGPRTLLEIFTDDSDCDTNGAPLETATAPGAAGLLRGGTGTDPLHANPDDLPGGTDGRGGGAGGAEGGDGVAAPQLPLLVPQG